MAITALDEAFIAPDHVFLRLGIKHRGYITGDNVRDWIVINGGAIADPYGEKYETLELKRIQPTLFRFLWPNRTALYNRTMLGKNTIEAGVPWYEYRYVERERANASPLITFACVATHNQFCLVNEHIVANRHAPVIKLHGEASKEYYSKLTSIFNSSTTCFWFKQVAHNKGSTVDNRGARQRTDAFEDFYEFTATQLKSFPLVKDIPMAFISKIEKLSKQLIQLRPDAILSKAVPAIALLAEQRDQFECTISSIITLQEELDWQCYELYGLIPQNVTSSFILDPPPLKLGQRSFESLLARKMAAGDESTTWFARHGSKPIMTILEEWPDDYRRVVEQRIKLIETDRNIGLIERPEYKRRWNIEPWEQQQEKALRNWLVDRLESYFDFDGRMNDLKDVTAKGNLFTPVLNNMWKVADLARQDKDFIQVAEIYTGRPDFDLANLVGDLITAESVPCLPVLRYKPSGLDKRTAWERTWELQRLEDAIDDLFDIERLRRIEPTHAEASLRPLISALPMNGIRNPRC